MSGSPLKILTVMPDFEPRGTQRIAQWFTFRFQRLGHHVAVLPTTPQGPRRAEFDAAGVRICDSESGIDAAIAQAIDFRPDAVHIHRNGPPSVIESGLLRALRPVARCIAETNVFARVDATIRELFDVHFHITRAGLYRWKRLARGVTDVPGIYVPYIVDLERFKRSDALSIERYRREILNSQPGDFFFGRIGKSDRRLLDAFAQIARIEPRVKLATVSHPETDPLVAQLPPELRSRVVTVPATNIDRELCDFYSSIDALLHWSPIGESFGMVLAESIACGTPVAMPLQAHRDIGGVEVIGHDEGGVIAGSGASLADAAIELMRRRPEFDARVARARERFAREYDVARISDLAIDAMRLVIDTRARGGDVREAFARDARFESDVSEAWFRDLLSRHAGPRSTRERVAQRVTHHPKLSKLVPILKRFAGA